MKTCIQFLQGKINPNILITVDENLTDKINVLTENKKVSWYTVYNRYIIFYDPNEKSKIQNSIFHNHNGNIFITSTEDRDLEEQDIQFWKSIIKTTTLKGKGIFIEEPPKSVKMPNIQRMNFNKSIKIN